jgi:Putative Ig domain
VPAIVPTLQIQASDSASGQTLSYTATGLPPGLAIDPATGLITGASGNAGVFAVTVTATDTTGASGSARFDWSFDSKGIR